MERRFGSLPLDLETRVGSDNPCIVGYAAVYFDAKDPGTEFVLWDYGAGDRCVERIFPGAFDAYLVPQVADGTMDVAALFNHDPNNLLGRKSSGTLSLSSDKRGLKYSITPPDSPLGKGVVESIRRGDLKGSSFSFTVQPAGQRFIRQGGSCIRELHKIDKLPDVGPVTFPAYSGTTTGTRAERIAWLRTELAGVDKQSRSVLADVLQRLERSGIETSTPRHTSPASQDEVPAWLSEILMRHKWQTFGGRVSSDLKLRLEEPGGTRLGMYVGKSSEILISPRVVAGVHPLCPARGMTGLRRFVDDLLLHECVHAAVDFACEGKGRMACDNSSHRGAFAGEAWTLTSKMPDSVRRKSWDRRIRDNDGIEQWPSNIRPRGTGYYVTNDVDGEAELAKARADVAAARVGNR